jgi:hypothetical protein
MPKKTKEVKERIMIQLDPETVARIRIFAGQTRTSVAEVIRRCVDESLDRVEVKISKEKA